MQHLCARQHQGTGRWVYSAGNRRGVYIIGACADHPEEGHATADEARECYRQYLLDRELALDGLKSSTATKCLVCGEWTDRHARVGAHQLFALCDAHRTREEVASRLTVTESWES